MALGDEDPPYCQPLSVQVEEVVRLFLEHRPDYKRFHERLLKYAEQYRRGGYEMNKQKWEALRREQPARA